METIGSAQSGSLAADVVRPAHAPAAPEPQAVSPVQRHPVEFSATAGEYFRIWIVNLALTVATLGIYSAWAKVRKKRYFYGHTRIGDDHFEYRGNPIAILKGRLLAVGVVALAAGIAAIVIGQGTKEDSATDADVQNLREELTGVEQSASQAAEDDVKSLSTRLTALEDQVGKLRADQGTTDDEISVVQDDIDDLRSEISDLSSAGTSGQ